MRIDPIEYLEALRYDKPIEGSRVALHHLSETLCGISVRGPEQHPNQDSARAQRTTEGCGNIRCTHGWRGGSTPSRMECLP